MSLDFDWIDGGGGGSGGQTIQYDVMPTPAIEDSIVQYTGETTASYTNGYFYKGVLESGVTTWQQINVQPTPEISTQETVGGNTELSADTGVLVIATPDGTEEKQVANVEYVNNIVGNIETALSQI